MMAVTAPRFSQPFSGRAASSITIKESLAVSIEDDVIHSIRLTPGHLPASINCALPTREQIQSYDLSLALTLQLGSSPDAGKRQRIKNLRRPLCQALLKAVPKEAHSRIAEAASAKEIVEIEISLADNALEQYPWELLGEPGLVCRAARHVVVWRRLISQGSYRSRPKRWQGNVLLAGSASMRHDAPYIREELTTIEMELHRADIAVESNCELVPSTLKSLLESHRAAVFHLAAHGTRDGILFQRVNGATLEEVSIPAKIIGMQLGDSDLVAGVFNCCDSASVPNAGGRPGAYEIAERTQASIIGIAGKIHPFAATIFARGFYSSLADGSSIAEAFYQGISTIRHHRIYNAMWSMPVMYSTDANVIPFPVDEESRARLSYQHIQTELRLLDQELAELVQIDCTDPAEWSDLASTPVVRMDCISSFLPALIGFYPQSMIDDEGNRLLRAQEDLQRALDSASAALELLGDIDCDIDQKKEALGQIYLFQRRHPRILNRLSQEFEDAL